uniref:SWIM-type domain-containing protein n=1 Tax=Lactuca sativa TaxID=4236 RepID=A0A9R1VYQ0_LACSA|nr:hypothetical protein LSAT_V11C400192710 [Lactuca sativa]
MDLAFTALTYICVRMCEHEESFNKLHVYLHNLRRTNLHTHTHIKTNLMDRFQSCFLAIGWVVHAFINCFLSVIFIGSVHLRGNYLKTMFVVVTKDGNNLNFPIAFGTAVENNLVSCTWFLMRLKESLGQGREATFISNMDDVISSCVDNVFTNSYHGYTWSLTIVLTPYAQMVLQRRMQKSIGWQATQIPQQISSPLPTNVYPVSDFKTTFVVDLNGHTCSCGKWRSLGITCGHAIAVHVIQTCMN